MMSLEYSNQQDRMRVVPALCPTCRYSAKWCICGGLKQRCERYINTRVATFEQRRERMLWIVQLLFELGLKHNDLIVDVGAGHCDLDYFLRVEGNWRGRYLPIDGAIDGTNIDATWVPPTDADFYVATEVIEHIFGPADFAHKLRVYAKKAALLTTPNPEVVNVVECDPTHVCSVSRQDLARWGYYAQPVKLFGVENDTLVAVALNNGYFNAQSLE